jgi:hypothetical protein
VGGGGGGPARPAAEEEEEEEEAEELAALERHDAMFSIESAVWCWFFAGNHERALWVGQCGLDLSEVLKATPESVAEVQDAMLAVRRGVWPRSRRSC